MSLSLFRFGAPLTQAWAFGMMGAARLPMSRIPDIGFWKLCGSGVGEGFTPIPNTAVWAILATWPNETIARARVADTSVYRSFRDRADEAWTVYLAPTSTRGQWSGKVPFTVSDTAQQGRLAALTRATIRPSKLLRFWNRAPAISDVIGDDQNVLFKIGIGEVPWLQQVTFSIWPDLDSMTAFARGDGPHGRAIKAVREGRWFREELYARFNVLGAEGQWEGRDPLESHPGQIAA